MKNIVLYIQEKLHIGKYKKDIDTFQELYKYLKDNKNLQFNFINDLDNKFKHGDAFFYKFDDIYEDTLVFILDYDSSEDCYITFTIQNYNDDKIILRFQKIMKGSKYYFSEKLSIPSFISFDNLNKVKFIEVLNDPLYKNYYLNKSDGKRLINILTNKLFS